LSTLEYGDDDIELGDSTRLNGAISFAVKLRIQEGSREKIMGTKEQGQRKRKRAGKEKKNIMRNLT
jgi:hypothetical protein